MLQKNVPVELGPTATVLKPSFNAKSILDEKEARDLWHDLQGVEQKLIDECVELPIGKRRLDFSLALLPENISEAAEFAAQCYFEKFSASEGHDYRHGFVDHRLMDPRHTAVFVARESGSLLATISMLFQYTFGDVLRSGEISGEASEVRRWIEMQPVGSILEISMLAAAKGVHRAALVAVRGLMALQYLYWDALPRHQKPRYMLITVHPDHQALYEMIGFVKLGRAWSYGGRRPAQTLVLEPGTPENFARIDRVLLRVFRPHVKPESLAMKMKSWMGVHRLWQSLSPSLSFDHTPNSPSSTPPVVIA